LCVSTQPQIKWCVKTRTMASEASDDAKLQSWYNGLSHISTHNAYHIGQMIFVRIPQGAWDPEKGVK